MRRTNWKTVSTLVTMVVIVGCQDRPVTAPATASNGVASAMLAPEGRPRLSLGDFSSLAANSDADFVVPPNGGTFFVGGNAVVFPAGSICDPATSSYGPGTWDQPCAPATSNVKIHAKVRTAKAGTWVDFSPALRFTPSSNPSKWVWLFMYNPAASASADVAPFTIKYAANIGDLGVDEGASDGSVRTYFDGALLLRRIKHFSGYTSSGGRSCDPATEPDCYPDNGGGSPNGP
jgi:hypothetical protein